MRYLMPMRLASLTYLSLRPGWVLNSLSASSKSRVMRCFAMSFAQSFCFFRMAYDFRGITNNHWAWFILTLLIIIMTTFKYNE